MKKMLSVLFILTTAACSFATNNTTPPAHSNKTDPVYCHSQPNLHPTYGQPNTPPKDSDGYSFTHLHPGNRQSSLVERCSLL
jgi:hypothetical protein